MTDVVDIWTGRSANALRQALRMTHETFAAKLGTSVRGVAKWSAEPDLVPVTELQRALDTTLSQSSDEDKARFRLLFGGAVQPSAPASVLVATSSAPSAADLKLEHDPEVTELLDWLDEHAGWEAPGCHGEDAGPRPSRQDRRSEPA